MTEPAAKSRGRPRAYERDAVLERALDVFWRKGFAATSLDDLVLATGVNRPSLYAGFGDKQALYMQAMGHFVADMTGRIGDALFGARQPGERAADVIERCLSMMAEVYTADPAGGLGCAVFCTTVTEAPGNAEIRGLLAESLAAIDAFFERFLRQAQAAGELGASLDVPGTAMLLGASLHSLGLRARGGQGREEIRRLACAAADLLRAHQVA